MTPKQRARRWRAACPLTHFDGLSNTKELYYGTDPNDRDSDDDGVLDGKERSWNKDTDGDGRINAMDPDSDNDGLTDGTEMGITEPVSGMGAGVKGMNNC